MFVGLCLGAIQVVVSHPPEWFRAHTLVATGLGNAGNLPLVLVAALMKEAGGTLAVAQDLSEDRAIAYVAMGIWVATLTHFTIGHHLLKQPVTSVSEDAEAMGTAGEKKSTSGQNGGNKTGVLQLLGGRKSAGVYVPMNSADHDSSVAVAVAAHEPKEAVAGHEPCAAVGRPSEGAVLQQASLHDVCMGRSTAEDDQKTEQQHLLCLDGTMSDARNDECTSTASTAISSTLYHSSPASMQSRHRHDVDASTLPTFSMSSSSYESLQTNRGIRSKCRAACWQLGDAMATCLEPCIRVLTRCGHAVWDLTTPPMVGCLASFIVGTTPVLRGTLFNADGPLRIVQDCIDMFGDCCIPGLMIMVGATLERGPGTGKLPVRVLVGVTAMRLLVLPLLGLAWIMGSYFAGKCLRDNCCLHMPHVSMADNKV